jgi:hypothetical protein
MYDENAPRLVAQGYFPLPISPADFKPAKAPVKWVPGPNKYVMFAGWNTRSSPCLTPQPGANIGVRCGNGVVAFDFDDEEAALAISEVFDPSPVNKAGQRAWTPFYRADFPVPSEDFFNGQGRKVLQILSDGRQTVIPPPIHPDTNEPYRWTNGRSLYDTPPAELPSVPRDYRERILALGYVSGQKKPADTINLETGEIENGFDDNPCAEFNSVALKNLPSWVPDLGLYNCKRRSGRYPAYDAVASWRPSTTGRPLEQRKRNLGIVGSGIKDFGTGNSYSPIDLVMAVRGGGVGEARCWLEEKLLPKKPEADIDIEKCVEAQDVPLIAPRNGDEQRADDGEAASGERKYRFRLMSFSELKPGVEPLYLVDELIPLAGIVVAWGKPKCFKSFWVLNLMLHVALGWEYRDRYVRQGTVVYCAFEGAHGYKKRVEALRRHYNIGPETDVPLYVIPGQADLIKEHKQLVKDIADQLSGRKPGVVVLDTLNKSLAGSESKDVDMAAYIRAAEAIRDAFGCVVVIIHHCGWDETRPRGHSSLPGAVDAQIAIVREGDVVTATVEYMRDGPEDVQETSTAKSVDVGVDHNGKVLTSLVLLPGGESVGDANGKHRSGNGLTDNEVIALKQLAKLCISDPEPIPTQGEQIAGLKGTSLSHWQSRVTRALWSNINEKTRSEMLKLQRGLQRKDKIDTDGEVVWQT